MPTKFNGFLKALCLFGILSLMIGLTLFLIGCNSQLYPYGCVRYTPKLGTVEKTQIVSRNDVQITWDVCTENVHTLHPQEIVDKYPIGGQQTVLIPKRDNAACISDTWELGVAMPVSGVFFIAVGLASVIIPVLFACCRVHLLF
jgi:hypothetical protein